MWSKGNIDSSIDISSYLYWHCKTKRCPVVEKLIWKILVVLCRNIDKWACHLNSKWIKLRESIHCGHIFFVYYMLPSSRPFLFPDMFKISIRVVCCFWVLLIYLDYLIYRIGHIFSVYKSISEPRRLYRTPVCARQNDSIRGGTSPENVFNPHEIKENLRKIYFDYGF